MSLTSLKLLFWDVLVVQALPVTLQLIAGSFVMACIIGLIGGIIRGLKVPVLSQILGIYVQLCRGIPDMLVLLFLYAVMTNGSTYSIAVLGISLIQGAYIMEIIKGGILSVDKGQWEAAKSLSLPIYTTLYHTFPNRNPTGYACCTACSYRTGCPSDQSYLRCIYHRMCRTDQTCNDCDVRFFQCADRLWLCTCYFLYYVPCTYRTWKAT